MRKIVAERPFKYGFYGICFHFELSYIDYRIGLIEWPKLAGLVILTQANGKVEGTQPNVSIANI